MEAGLERSRNNSGRYFKAVTIALAPDQSAVLKALRTFLLSILPSKVEVILAQVNRVPEPKAKDFVLMTPIRRERLETNVDSAADACVVGSIAGNILTHHLRPDRRTRA